MANELTCDKCGGTYDSSKSLKVDYQGKNYQFDCFECAISTIAPKCENCGTTIIGHGKEQNSQIFCCDHCLQS